MKSGGGSGKLPGKRSGSSSGRRRSTAEGVEDQLPKDLLDSLPPQIKQLAQKGDLEAIEILSMFFYRGPCPPPQVLEEFERVLPGSGARILQWTEQQSSHRQRLEALQTESSETRMDRGQWLGFTIAGASLIAAVAIMILAPNSWPTTAAAVFIAALGVGGPAVARIIAGAISDEPDPKKSQTADHE